jgi:hypothetical protein
MRVRTLMFCRSCHPRCRAPPAVPDPAIATRLKPRGSGASSKLARNPKTAPRRRINEAPPRRRSGGVRGRDSVGHIGRRWVRLGPSGAASRAYGRETPRTCGNPPNVRRESRGRSACYRPLGAGYDVFSTACTVNATLLRERCDRGSCRLREDSSPRTPTRARSSSWTASPRRSQGRSAESSCANARPKRPTSRAPACPIRRHLFVLGASPSTEVLIGDGPSHHRRVGRGTRWPRPEKGTAYVRRDASRCPYGVQTQLDTRSQQFGGQQNPLLCRLFE